MFGGFLACSITHAGVAPLDVAKCRAQAHFKARRWPAGLARGLRLILAKEGLAGATKGWAPTFCGYGAQGLCKFGLNEVFKDLYTEQIGEEKLKAQWKRMALWAAASGSAELFADVALCPFEMTKVHLPPPLPAPPLPLTPTSPVPAPLPLPLCSCLGPLPSYAPVWAPCPFVCHRFAPAPAPAATLVPNPPMPIAVHMPLWSV